MSDVLDFRDVDWVAERLNIDKNAVYRYLNDGLLPGLQLGRKWLISESSLVQHLKAEEQRQTHARRQLGLHDPEFYRRFRLSDRARRVLLLAQAEAVMRNFDYIGQEHILLGIAGVPDSAGLRVLTALGVSAERLRAELDAVVPDTIVGVDGSGDIELTPRARRAVELAAEEARELTRPGLEYVGVEHLLLGVLREGEGFGYRVLGRLGVTLDQARAALRRHLDTLNADGQPTTTDVSERGGEPAATAS